jgi:hypothetical protein
MAKEEVLLHSQHRYNTRLNLEQPSGVIMLAHYPALLNYTHRARLPVSVFLAGLAVGGCLSV